MRQADTSEVIVTVKAAVIGVDTDNRADVIEDAAILIRGGTIASIGNRAAIVDAYPGVQVDPMPGAIAMPGLVNAHHHTGLTPLQLGMPLKPLELWLPLFMGVRSVDPRLDTLYSAVEMLESGVTTVHNIQGGVGGSPEEWDGEADSIIAAYGEIGMRCAYSFMMRDQNQVVYEDDASFLARLEPDVAAHFRPGLVDGLVPIRDQLAFFAALKARWQDRSPDMVRLQLAPANLHWCSDRALQDIFETARAHDVKLHMHLDETKYQADYARTRTGTSAVAHLAQLGCLGPELTIGHGIWTNEQDLDLLQDHGCCLCHNPSSGMRLASGIAPVNLARARGISVALGIDQCGINDDRDMLQEMRVAWMLHRTPGLFADRPGTAEVLRMATEHGAATTGFGNQIGRLDAGRAADIVLIDWAAVTGPYLDETTSIIDALIHRAKTGAVRQVYVAGKRVVEDGRVCSIDRDGLMLEIGEAMSRPLTTQEQTRRDMTQRLIHSVDAYYRAAEDTSDLQAYRFNLTQS